MTTPANTNSGGAAAGRPTSTAGSSTTAGTNTTGAGGGGVGGAGRAAAPAAGTTTTPTPTAPGGGRTPGAGVVGHVNHDPHPTATRTDRAWLRWSAAWTTQARVLTGRSDLTVTVAPGAGDGAPACHIPALAAIEVDATLIGDPDVADPRRPGHKKKVPAAYGALVHEAAHAVHSRWNPPAGTAPILAAAHTGFVSVWDSTRASTRASSSAAAPAASHTWSVRAKFGAMMVLTAWRSHCRSRGRRCRWRCSARDSSSMSATAARIGAVPASWKPRQ